MESYTVIIVVQSASGTYTRTLSYDNAADAEKARQAIIKQVEKMGG